MDQRVQKRACSGQLCTQTMQDAFANGTQLSGSMQLVTEDPVSFCASPAIEQILKSAITTFAMHPVTHVHVSLMPGVFVGDLPRTVDIWFSMVVPDSSNISDVAKWLRKSSTDLPQATKQAKSWLTTGGIDADIMITRFTLTKLVKLQIPSMPPTTNPPAVVDWQQANASRLTGVVKVVLKCQATQYAMDSIVKNASETMLGELVNAYVKMQIQGVHASTVPDQIWGKGQDNAEGQAMEQMQAALAVPVTNLTGEVDTWYSILGQQYPTSQEAIAKAKQACEALQAVNLSTVSSILGSHLVGSNDCWQDPVAVFLSCKAEDDEDCHSDVPQRVTGLLELRLKAPRVFAADVRSEQATKATIADLANVSVARVRVNLLPEKSEITIVLPPVPASLLEEDSPARDFPIANVAAEIDEVVYAWYVINAPTKPLGTADKILTRLQETEITLAELKLQNNLIKYGLDNTFITVSKITAQLEETGSGSSTEAKATTITTTGGYVHVVSTDPVAEKPFSRQNMSGPANSTDAPNSTGLPNSTANVSSEEAKVTVKEGSDIIATAARILENATVSASDAPPSQVVAVVANVESTDSAPPTLSNPGGGDEEADTLIR